jgi:hypothetical protein
MWITCCEKHSFTRTGIRTTARRVRRNRLVRARFDVPAQPALSGNVLHVAHCQPHAAGLHAGGKRLVRGTASDTGQNQGAAEDPRVPGAEFVVHKPPIIADSHQKSLSWSGA